METLQADKTLTEPLFFPARAEVKNYSMQNSWPVKLYQAKILTSFLLRSRGSDKKLMYLPE